MYTMTMTTMTMMMMVMKKTVICRSAGEFSGADAAVDGRTVRRVEPRKSRERSRPGSH